jgi:hypothetical protein
MVAFPIFFQIYATSSSGIGMLITASALKLTAYVDFPLSLACFCFSGILFSNISQNPSPLPSGCWTVHRATIILIRILVF